MAELVIFLIILSGLFFIIMGTGAETALNNFPRSKFKPLFEKLDKKQNYAYCSSLLRASLFLARMFGNILVISLATAWIVKAEYIFPDHAWKLGGVILSVLTILVFIGSILPSAVAMRSPETFIRRIFPVIQFFYAFFKPLSVILIMIGKGLTPEDARGIYSEFITEEDLIDVIEAGEKEGTIEKEERIMLHSVIEFGDKIVREVMVPRIDVVSIEENSSIEEVLRIFEKEGFSRIPVYKDNVDNIIGILYVRDLLQLWRAKEKENRSIKEIVHEPFFVPETKLISDLFREFKQKKTHIAVVVDEYGGTAGLITLEDLIEEIVGEIQDEYDVDEEKPIKKISSGIFLVQSKALIDEINKTLDLSLEESDDFDTIGGFIIDQMGKIPQGGDILKIGSLEITILEADERSIKKVRIKKTGKEHDGQ
ncbi:MAG: HlyC/CorC family transporter [Candidatus Aureabacteria bacterium]|nr:HlyC/CorC family transporter [Candidatus Auribacterota bacterium]